MLRTREPLSPPLTVALRRTISSTSLLSCTEPSSLPIAIRRVIDVLVVERDKCLKRVRQRAALDAEELADPLLCPPEGCRRR